MNTKSLDSRRNKTLGHCHWAAVRLIEAEVDYFRLSIFAFRGEDGATESAENARTFAEVFAASLAENMAEAFELGVSHQSVVIAEAAANRIAEFRSEITRAENHAGRIVPQVPTASGELAPWITGRVAA